MKLGVHANCFLDKPLDEACNAAKAIGLQAIEFGSGGFVGKAHCNPGQLLKDEDALKKFRKIIYSYDLELSAISCHGNVLHPDKDISAEHISDLETSVMLAGKLGLKVVNTFAGCPGAGEDAKYPNWITCPWPPYFGEAVKWQWEKKIIPFWKEMVKKARKAGVFLGFEMHPGDAVYNPELLLKLREEVNAEEIACNLDPAHLFWQGINPIAAIRRLGKAIVHVHAKDVKIDSIVSEWRGVLDWKPYQDVINRGWTFRTCGYGQSLGFWNDFVSNLRLIGFDGVISIEHEDILMSAEEGLSKAVNFLKGVVLY